ncbi:MAG: 30S ribosomal protein S9 [Chitinophagales bacterium]
MSQINAVGRRKSSVSRAFLSHGTGKVIINGKDYKEYITVPHLSDLIVVPFKLTNTEGKFDFKITVRGGGVKGQAEAIALSISRALVKENADCKPALKAEDMMTRDARIVERKKPGLRKARKRAQFSKR